MRNGIKYLIYNIIYPLAVFIRIDILSRMILRNKRMILMYHGVSSKKQFKINARHLPARQFERHLIYFKKNFNIVSLEEICRMQIDRIKTEKHTIALTFDDGFMNNYTVALPLLIQYKIPATFFICGCSIQDENYIHPFDLLDIVSSTTGDEKISIAGQAFIIGKKYQLVNICNGIPAYDFLNSLSFNVWQNTLKKFVLDYVTNAKIAEIDNEAFKLMSKQTLHQMSNADYASIGSHSYDHINLTQLSEEEILNQLKESKKILKHHSGKRITAIAFPSGYYNAKVIELAKDAGYEYLIAAGDVDQVHMKDIFPRIGIMSGASFAFNILSINKGFGRFGF